MHKLSEVGFFSICLLTMACLRRLGWACSRNFLYTSNSYFCAAFLTVWGLAIALLLRYTTLWLRPGLVLWTFSVFAGVYASIPNYGLFSAKTIPEEAQLRHFGIQWLPLVVFMLSFVVITTLVRV